MPDGPAIVLFLCTGNSARSILAEAILNDPAVSGGRVRGVSAGSRPRGTVNPGALERLRAEGLPTEGLRSKSWDEFAAAGAPEIDAVITLCDDAAGETCPVWPGRPVTVHWGLPDPAVVEGEDARREAFRTTYQIIRGRLVQLAALPLASLDPAVLRARLAEIAAA